MRPQQVIVTHAGMDFDALGACLAARRLYPQAVVCVQGGMNRNVREFAALHADELELMEAARLNLDAVERVVVVETSHRNRLGELGEVIGRPGVEVSLFDHHGADEPAPDWVSEGCCVCSADGALSTTMVGILAERGLEPTPTEATALTLGIHEDTGSLTYPTTTLRDIEALAFCARHGASQELVGGFLHTPLGAGERALLTALVDSAETHSAGGTPVLVAAVRWGAYVDGISTLATKLVELSDCRALVMLVEMDDRVFVVGRSRVPALDMRAALAPVGGGGHAQASSAIVRGAALADVRATLLRALPGAVAEAPRARDIMSTPAWFVDASATIDEAIAECRRRHTSGVQISAGGVLVGAAAREDLDRAIGHGLGHAPVRAVMSSQVDAVAPDAPLAEVQRALARSAGGRLAVLEGADHGPPAVDAVLGVVTRSDLLAALREAPAAGAGEAEIDVSDRLAGLGLDALWRAVQQAGAEFAGVHLVGGAVRDLLLGERSFDIDLAVEGDGVAFAARLARALGGRMHPHEVFHTAVVLAGDLRVDVASSRTEQYEYPAALPTVEHSSIRHDLFRRDFTINAMAVALRSGEFGRLLDPYGGRADLEAGVLRVLHNLSFIEDPTRIFRGIRYENRFGFAMDARTRELARGCVDMGLVGELSGARVRDELVALLSERSVAGALRRLAELGLARSLHPGLDPSPEAIDTVERLDELRAEHLPDLPAWRARLGAIARPLGGDELVSWLESLRVRRRDARAVEAAAVVGPRLLPGLERAATPAAIAELLDPHPDEAALMAAALGSAAAMTYLAGLRRVRLEVNGGVLLRELGLTESPLVGELLAELLRRKRNGELDGLQDELDTARRLLAEAGE